MTSDVDKFSVVLEAAASLDEENRFFSNTNGF